jgi:circadian clock protein KaiC
MKRIKTYVKYLDEKLNNGIPVGHTVLVCGSTGTMKSSFSFYMLYNLAKNDGIKSVYISLEQKKKDLLEHMSSMGVNINDVKDYIRIETLSDLRKESKKLTMGMNWPAITLDHIKQLKEKEFDIVVVDSFNALCALSKTNYSRVDLMEFFEGLKNLGLTAFLIYETPKKSEFVWQGVEEFLADGIINLTMERRGETVTRHLNIVKMRKTKHATDYFPLLIDEEGFGIVAK